MKSYILPFLLFISSTAFASKANFCLEAYLVEARNGDGVASMSCDIEQSLKWEDSSALFMCSFGKNGREEIFIDSVWIGSDLAHTGWTDYSMNEADELGAFLQRGLGLKDVKKSQTIRIIYSGNELWSRDENIIIETKERIYKLLLKTNIGECATFFPQI